MQNEYELVNRLTSAQIFGSEKNRMLNDFAQTLGWNPTDRFEARELENITNAHLLVEHGLEQTAVISFFKYPRRYTDLSVTETQQLLAISYNNLVDWHIQVDSEEFLFVYNRTTPPRIVQRFQFSRREANKLRSEVFEQVTGARQNPNIPALDDALIRTISYWKRNLAAELENKVSNEQLSALFNTLIFIRAAEDDAIRRTLPPANGLALSLYNLCADEIPLWSNKPFTNRLLESLQQHIKEALPSYVFDANRLAIFNKLDPRTVRAMVGDFYQNKYAPYRYDFSLMSKHALSRIYEHYVTLLREKNDDHQLHFLPALPDEKKERSFGSVYTPQFIGRFFARYLREQMPPILFRRIKSIDPACGSGIFLRTLLELQCEPPDEFTTEQIMECFQNVSGLDRDENACQATRLSLALLHLVLLNWLPTSLDIQAGEILQRVQSGKSTLKDYDVVLANPPFVPTVHQETDLKNRLTSYMKNYAVGRVDLYLAFLKIGIEALKPHGFGLFVLPHNFLLAKNATKMREFVSENCWIRCLVDLKDVTVFEDVGSYVVLLIIQRKGTTALPNPNAIFVKCQDFVGTALQYVIEGRQIQTSLFSVYEIEQATFTKDEWHILPPVETNIKKKFEQLRPLQDFLEIREGFITGADPVFLIPNPKVPKGEKSAFVPYLADREMGLYSVPKKTARSLFYPYENGKRLTEDQVKEKFPATWEYLKLHRAILKDRSPVKSGHLEWWMPVRPRRPEHMMRPKIVTPHLVLVPRFAFDAEGRYAVSHSPFLYPHEGESEDDVLHFFLAVLNSTSAFWHITVHSHSYQRSYARLEAATLSQTPVPDPTKVDPTIMRQILRLVDKRLTTPEGEPAQKIERELDSIVADLYRLTEKERKGIGMEK